MSYRGRFAPSPTGPLHAGSLVAALASWLDAQAHGGQWRVRIEDVDTPRTVPGAAAVILNQLAALQLLPQGEVVYQSNRSTVYQKALDNLVERRLAYACTCSRKTIELALLTHEAMNDQVDEQVDGQAGQIARPRHGELVYPGTCRHKLALPPKLPQHDGDGSPASAWRFFLGFFELKKAKVPVNNTYKDTLNIAKSIKNKSICHWLDRRLGPQQQDVESTVGDFVLRRADGCFSYQLAVVVDDAAQGITDVVRGEDLADNTARQIALQQALGLQTPRYLHTSLVRGANGEKLSKQNGAQAVDVTQPLVALNAAAQTLGLAPFGLTDNQRPLGEALSFWVNSWAHCWTSHGPQLGPQPEPVA